MHHRRKRSRRKVKCRLCTPGRIGNSLNDAPKHVLRAAEFNTEATAVTFWHEGVIIK